MENEKQKGASLVECTLSYHREIYEAESLPGDVFPALEASISSAMQIKVIRGSEV